MRRCVSDMRAGTKLGLYAMALVAIFVVGFVGARAFIPPDASAGWTVPTDHGTEHPTEMAGLSIEQNGYQIRDVAAPGVVGRDGTLSFRLTGPGRTPVTAPLHSCSAAECFEAFSLRTWTACMQRVARGMSSSCTAASTG